MAQGNDNRNDVVYSHSLTEEATNTQRQRLVAGTLTYPPPMLPTIPFDLIAEILCRLPVKLLIQLRCLCKFFNSLISDPKFAKKHLRMATKRHHLMLKECYKLVMYDFPIPSILSTSTVFRQTQIYPPNTITIGHQHYVDVECSCDGIFCGELNFGSYFVWNPSIRKFKLLPPLKNQLKCAFSISFGYDCFIDNYKVVVVSSKNEVFVYTLGTDYWTRIDDIPYSEPICEQGVFVSDTVNWYAKDGSGNSLYFILSLDLKSESYHKLYLPDFENGSYWWKLGVQRDCLCVIETNGMFSYVWIMKEYGKKESWTKLYTIPNLQNRGLEAFTALYISEDDQLLVHCHVCEAESIKLVVYDSKTDTSNIPEFQNNYEHTHAKVYIESLISP